MKPTNSLRSILLAALYQTHARAAPTSATLASSLFPPTYQYTAGFTTAADVSIPGISTVPLADAPLNVIRASPGFTHSVVQQAGKTAWEAVYAAGSWNPSNAPHGGFGFYLGGSDAFAQALQAGAREAVFGYSLMFQDGFQWNKGGKLPGGFGGIGSSAYECAGGRQDGRDECFDLRLMWRTNGAGELYTYLPLTDQNSAALSTVKPETIENPAYGYSVGRGAYTFPAGQWMTVAERIKLNDPGVYNGEIQLWVDGELVIDAQGISMRDSSSSLVQGMHFQTFFGGSTSDWGSPQTQKAWFADVSGAIIQS